MLMKLTGSELDAALPVDAAGGLTPSARMIAGLVSRACGLVGVRVGLAGADYLQHADGSPEISTRSATGIWWHSRGDDTATIGGFVIDGLAMTITTENEGESPVAESAEVIDRATNAIASQYEGGEVVGSGLIEVPGPSGRKRGRVFVTRDHRVRRPQDLLDPDELAALGAEELGLVIVQLIGGGKALVVKHGI